MAFLIHTKRLKEGCGRIAAAVFRTRRRCFCSRRPIVGRLMEEASTDVRLLEVVPCFWGDFPIDFYAVFCLIEAFLPGRRRRPAVPRRERGGEHLTRVLQRQLERSKSGCFCRCGGTEPVAFLAIKTSWFSRCFYGSECLFQSVSANDAKAFSRGICNGCPASAARTRPAA